MGTSYTVASAEPTERAAAFDLVFQHFGPTERQARVANALQLIELGELPAEGVWVARHEARVVGALVCLALPGASGLVWPPQVAFGINAREVEDQLIRRAAAWLRGRGAKLAQALLTEDEKGLAPPLERNGFSHITSLWYLRHDLSVLRESSAGSQSLGYQTATTTDPRVFQDTLLRTYEGTLDCPEVNGVRTIGEVLAGHRGQRTEDPATWWLVVDAGEPAGVVMVTEMPDSRTWDLSYLGVVPKARGRGLGREMVQKVLLEARAAGVSGVSLSVDTRNRPAWQLYLAAGFQSYDRREVYLAVWR
jgi:ribosomal protein S18 acetylase RimI-like enzyme